MRAAMRAVALSAYGYLPNQLPKVREREGWPSYEAKDDEEGQEDGCVPAQHCL